MARAYSIPIDEFPTMDGRAISATISVYIIRNRRTAEVSFDRNPTNRQNLW
jgi:hypothetical protein